MIRRHFLLGAAATALAATGKHAPAAPSTGRNCLKQRWALAPTMAHSAQTAGSGAIAKKLEGKAYLYEGHGFSRAINA
jgi:hypothetical protein